MKVSTATVLARVLLIPICALDSLGARLFDAAWPSVCDFRDETGRLDQHGCRRTLECGTTLQRTFTGFEWCVGTRNVMRRCTLAPRPVRRPFRRD